MRRSLRSAALIAIGASLSLCALAATPSAADTAKVPEKVASAWKRWGGGWVRLEADGQLSCFSRDGTHCAWGFSVADANAVPDAAIKPLVCGTPHKLSAWGITGYNDGDTRHGERHWCRSAYATLFAKWQDHTVLGTPLMLAETPAGDLMCHSTDGRNCTPARDVASKPAAANAAATEVHPLVCGAHHRRMHGHDGYGQAGHWCQTPKILHAAVDVTVKPDAADTELITTPSWVAKDEPALVVRTKIPEGQTLVLGSFASFSRPLGPFKSTQGPAGFSAGKLNMVHAAGNYQEAPWKAPITTGPLTMAFKVTEKGHMCYFAADEAKKRDGAFISPGALLGDSVLITNFNRIPPIGFLSSASVKVNVGGHSVLMPAVYGLSQGPAASSSFKIDQLFLVAARHVPVEGDLTGAKRKITYAPSCDQTTPAF